MVQRLANRRLAPLEAKPREHRRLDHFGIELAAVKEERLYRGITEYAFTEPVTGSGKWMSRSET
jgi:hypothetical protein